MIKEYYRKTMFRFQTIDPPQSGVQFLTFYFILEDALPTGFDENISPTALYFKTNGALFGRTIDR